MAFGFGGGFLKDTQLPSALVQLTLMDTEKPLPFFHPCHSV